MARRRTFSPDPGCPRRAQPGGRTLPARVGLRANQRQILDSSSPSIPFITVPRPFELQSLAFREELDFLALGAVPPVGQTPGEL